MNKPLISILIIFTFILISCQSDSEKFWADINKTVYSENDLNRVNELIAEFERMNLDSDSTEEILDNMDSFAKGIDEIVLINDKASRAMLTVSYPEECNHIYLSILRTFKLTNKLDETYDMGHDKMKLAFSLIAELNTMPPTNTMNETQYYKAWAMYDDIETLTEETIILIDQYETHLDNYLKELDYWEPYQEDRTCTQAE